MSSGKGDQRVLLPLYVSTTGTWGAYALIVVVLPFRFQELGLSVLEYGVALAVYALGTLATESLWGYLAFHLGSARWLGLLAAATVASMLALGFARSFATFAALLGLYGMLVIYSTPLIRWVGMTSIGPGRRSRGLGVLGLFFGLGLTAGTAVGPVLYALGGFWLNVYAGVALFAISTIPLLRIPWASLPLPRARRTDGGSLRPLLQRPFLLAVLLVVLYFMAYSLVTSFLQYYSISLYHGSVEGAGYVIGAARGVALITGVLLGSVVDRWGPRRASPVGFLLLVAGALGSWLSQDYGEMTAATLLLAAGAGWLSVSLLPLALSRIPSADQGTAVGVFGSFEDLGLILGPLLLGEVYVALGPSDLFPAAAAVALLGLVLAWTGERWPLTAEMSGHN